MFAFFEVVIILWKLWQKLEGSPAEKRRKILERIEASSAKFEETGDTTDLGNFG